MARKLVSAKINLSENLSLSKLTTLGIGGPCKWLTTVHNLDELCEAYEWSVRHGLEFFALGEGSNVLASDIGFPGLVIRNGIRGRHRSGNEVKVGSGENLSHIISWLNLVGLGGMERLYGIPGTVGGAVVGNAGAYGQEISQVVHSVAVFTGKERLELSASQLDFRYRSSLFKCNPSWYLIDCRLRFRPTSHDLQSVSEAILKTRLTKYPPKLKCPGSFFKNVPVSDLTPEAMSNLPDEFVVHGKVPAGKLLEAVGANGARLGKALIAEYHGNLLINVGGAKSEDLLGLADRYAARVLERFGIRLTPEVVILDTAYSSRVGPEGEGN